METHGFSLSLARTDLASVWRRVIDELASEHPALNVLVVTRGDGSGDWDLDQLAQVAQHLLTNALHHGTPGQPISIHIDGRDAARVVATVHNHGAVPPATLPVIFDSVRGGQMFRARQIIVAHGGSIDVSSSYADGTMFYVSLPRT